ncbi:3'-5' exonuclease [Alcanivorax sp. HI0033]|jgi:predicted PolB exonuclease-like 3'-5' exonuclease|uniref:3'-5' exonuclease n=1 Tax=unclassified Alcanivorax TaxID=2638842 RepID=UPI0007B8F9E3|nr:MULTISPECIES: 3'-5' exonuclease [unclassified Alcanivorax]KZX77581.1 3'-5' exonuclease [Alcanivorax sp. HI0013]KZX84854.1 3'-5' exonuclease [Alcanivorax sp. HI0011]KZY19973.1 3'-5' exonuclease [Alcanivorax sp. HI0035]KZX66271.1 3'-5' exonuclease [Alcanivorax sp. HI0007]KZX70500.1 3'-5' exonuclease [Alcanivorax sp. HI0003]
MNVLVFDIETIPDLDGGRRIYDLDGLSDKDTASALLNLRRQENGTEFLRLHLHRIVAISVVLRSTQGIKVWSLGDEDSSEKELIERFYDGIDRFTPNLVSWNGGGFDLPVLHYRALKHGVQARRYWETGNEDSSFKWNNYLSRYHQRHLDLMDQLALFNARANAPLDQIATLLGFPGKMGMSGGKVFDAFQEGNLKGIRDYCETDVLNTWLVYLRFQLMRGELDPTGYEQELTLLQDYLKAEGHPHFLGFLEAWQG